MNKRYIPILFLLFLSTFISSAQNHYQRFETIDVQHYMFDIHLNDSTNRIEGKTNVLVKFLKATDNLILDLTDKENDSTGMVVTSVKMNNSDLSFTHKNSELKIHLPEPAIKGAILNFEIQYSGIPEDGLIISTNQFGKRTFFGDNWPNRARNWLPGVDHPSDKATLEFLVYAPNHYEVIANGKLAEKKQLKNNMEFTHWIENVPIATKLMVIGLADFAIGNKTNYKNIPVSSWVFQQNKEKGFKNYHYGTKALQYFSELIGPYSYEKLAHVQSKTRYGGMENASCIFYNENSAISDRSQETLFAHEVAHQWFGNSVTEQNWHHIWLSEGFATYLTHLYNRHFYGDTVFYEGLKKDRERVIRYSKRNLAPVIDTTVTEYIRLLNANSYQKASWVLHMLNQDLGDEIFFKGLQQYYANHQNGTALTQDFQKEMETVSGKDLNYFFKQWLWQPGHPLLNFHWVQSGNKLIIDIEQLQKEQLFRFNLEVKLLYKDGSSELEIVNINKQKNSIILTKSRAIQELLPDPNTKLLYELVQK